MLAIDYSRYGGWMREATRDDLVALAPRLRQADKDECLALTGLPPEMVLPTLAPAQHCYVSGVIESDRPELVVGLAPTTEGAASIYMVSSDVIFDYKLRFLRVSRVVVDEAHKEFPILSNFVDARNTEHIKWLQWLGFQLLRKEPMGPFSLPFIDFVSYREQCAYP